MRRGWMTVALGAWVALAGCGSGSNDQGISFRLLGVFQETVEQFAPAADTFPTSLEDAVGDSGRIISLADTQFVPNDINGDGDLDGGFIGMQNVLETQRLNVQGLNVSIFIPGAVIPNPVATDFVPLSVTLDPVPSDDNEDAVNTRFVQTLFVSADVMAFLNQNQTLWPATPFNLNVVMTATAVSDSGDRFTSNEITYNIVVLP
jgi:hypothetical protein